MTVLESRTVDWWAVQKFVEPLLDEAGSWPLAGSLAWQQIPDDDPAKLAAVLDAGRHWALRIDTCQDALAQASQAISTAADWPLISRRIHQRRTSGYIPRKASCDRR